MYSGRSVSDIDQEYEDRYIQPDDLYNITSIYELETILRTFYPETQSQPDEFGCIRRDPIVETIHYHTV